MRIHSSLSVRCKIRIFHVRLMYFALWYWDFMKWSLPDFPSYSRLMSFRGHSGFPAVSEVHLILIVGLCLTTAVSRANRCCASNWNLIAAPALGSCIGFGDLTFKPQALFRSDTLAYHFKIPKNLSCEKFKFKLRFNIDINYLKNQAMAMY